MWKNLRKHMSQLNSSHSSRRGVKADAAQRIERACIESLENRCLLSAVVTTGVASSISKHGATLNATVNPRGSTIADTFQYSTDPAFTPIVATTIGSGFTHPLSVAVDAAGDVFVADGDGYSNAIWETRPDGNTAFASFPAQPTGVAVDAAGDVFVADGDAVYEVSSDGTTSRTLGLFQQTSGIAVDAAGDVVVTDSSGLHEIPANGNAIQTLDSGFTNPLSVAVDAAGNLFVTDGSAVHEISANGNSILTLDLGFITTPLSVAVDAAGNLFVTDDSAVYEMPADGTPIRTLDSEFGFNNPQGLAVDAAGDVFVADGYGRVVELSPLTVAATPATSVGSTDTAVSVTLTGLASGTTYYYRAVVQGPDATVDGATGSFTTTSPPPPLASFSGRNGIYPMSDVTLDANGNLWGTTRFGGPDSGSLGDGVLFEVAKGTGTITPVAFFNGTNGDNPVFNGLITDAAGNVWGVASVGGAFNGGVVFEVIKGSNAMTTVASFNPQSAANPEGGLAFDASGNLYGTAAGGGPTGDGTVFEVVKGSGVITPLAFFNGQNGHNPQGGVTVDANGDVYGATTQGGSSNNGVVFEVVKGSGVITPLVSFNRTNGSYPCGDMAMDAGGNLYGTALFSTTANGIVFEVAKGSGSITILATFNVINGAGPCSLLMDPNGNIFGVTDAGGESDNGTLFEVVKGSGTVTSLTSFEGTNGRRPVGGITMDAAGHIYGTTNYGGASDKGTVFEFTLPPQATSLTAGALTPPTAIEGVAFSNQTVFQFTTGQVSATARNFTAVVTLGDGTSVTLTGTPSANGQIVADGSGFDVQLSYTYAEQLAAANFSVAVSDAGGAGTSASISTFSVTDAALTANALDLDQTYGTDPGSQTLAQFQDLGGAEALTDYSATINWGDGTAATAATINHNAATSTFRVTGDHPYHAAGQFQAQVTISHDSAPNAVVTSTITVAKATLTATANNQSKTYGQNNPTLTGTFTGAVSGDGISVGYSTTAGQFSDAGGSYSITATLNDPNGKLSNYLVSNTPATLTISRADQTIAWATPTDIVYGMALGGTQLNATVAGVSGGSTAGALTYTPASGTVLNAGAGQTLHVSAAATTNYNAAGQDVQINVSKADATIGLTPYAVTYDGLSHTATGTATGVKGESLSGLSLTGTTHAVAGDYGADTWTFSDAIGNYADARGTVSDSIAKASSATTTIGAGPFTYDATTHSGGSGTVSGANGLNVPTTSLTYSGSQVNAGTYYVTAHYGGDANYTASDGAPVAITIAKANQTIAWSKPAEIVYGTPLSGAQLNATASGVAGGSLPGTVSYAPAAGQILLAGAGQSLTVQVAATANYNAASATVLINVLQATPAFSNLVSPLSVTLDTLSVPFSGKLSFVSGGIPFIPSGSVIATLSKVTSGGSVVVATSNAVLGTNGNFSGTFAIAVDGTGSYVISYSYAGDANFKSAAASTSMAIDYGISVLSNTTKAAQSGSTIPLKLELTDANGVDVSSSSVVLKAVGIASTATPNTLLPVLSPGNSQPGSLFTFDNGNGGEYQFNLKTTGLAAGTYLFYFTAGSDPMVHAVQFAVK